ncbi:MAG: DUF928 domain-containing protein [Phormidesmis sp. RL_2_1]|nr:DUF928 domain-containing protein [Phormidesmis sp. RL_2_1]
MTVPRLIVAAITVAGATTLSTTVTLLSIQPRLTAATPVKVTAIHPSTANKAFRPPNNPRRRSGYRTTTGTRQGSCVGDSETAFTILGPSETMGLTASTRPSFAWYLPPSETAYPVQFRLLAPNERGIPAPIYTTDLDYADGFNTYQLPAEAAALSPGIEYRWQIVVVCDAGYLSRSLNQERSFELVSPSTELQQSLATATTAAEQALAYGENGVWYDAIAQVAQANTSQSIAVRQALLAALAEIESEDELFQADLLQLSAQ